MPETKKIVTKKPAVKKVEKTAVAKQEVLIEKKEVKAVPDVITAEEAREAAELDAKLAAEPSRYFEAVGRRKTSIARIRLFTKGDKEFIVNDKPFKLYFPTIDLQQTAASAFEKMKCLDKFRVEVKVSGGGVHSQAEAVRHAAARALVDFNADFRKRLRKVGYLTRDPRMRERKKFGLKRARRAPQWAKR